jgi:hypothetical protein
MRKFIPFIFLLPVLLLLVFLPRQLRGQSPYPVSLLTYFESLVGWLLLFCGVFAMSRGSRWSRVFFVSTGLVMIAGAGYSLLLGKLGLFAFVGVLAGTFVSMGYAYILSPPIRKRLEDERDDAA